jgi:hypothetical protein
MNRKLEQANWLQRREVGEVARPQRFVLLLRYLDVSPSRSCQLGGILAPPQSGIILSDHVIGEARTSTMLLGAFDKTV